MDVMMKLDRNTDADIIQRLATEKSIDVYLKRLIREDIGRAYGAGNLEKVEQSFDATLRLLKQVAGK